MCVTEWKAEVLRKIYGEMLVRKTAEIETSQHEEINFCFCH
jgi:hypothetical protein